MNLENGDIILFRVQHFSRWYRWLLAKLIQLIDRTYYHHCAIFYEGLIHEADAKGIVVNPISKYRGSNYIVLRAQDNLSPFEKTALQIFIKNQLGKKYDYESTLLFQLIYRLTGIWIGTTHKNAESKLTCSEHCVLPYHDLRGFFRKPWLVSPGDIMRSKGYFKIIKEGKL